MKSCNINVILLKFFHQQTATTMDMNVDMKIPVGIQHKCIVVWKVVIMTTEIIVHMMKLTGIIIDLNLHNKPTHTHIQLYKSNHALNVSSN